MLKNNQQLEPKNWFSCDNTKKINTILLLIHVSLCVIFFLSQVKVMVLVNIVSALLYASMYLVINKKPRIFTLCINGEIMVYTFVAVVCTGYDTGFQLYLIALMAVDFFADYCAKKIKEKTMHPYVTSAICAVLFLTAGVIGQWKEPLCTIPPLLVLAFFCINVVLTLGFLVYYLSMYEKLTLEAEGKLKKAAERDELTGLHNRHYMNAMLTNQFEDFLAGEDKMAVAMIDIDDFKKINDTYGHSAGDLILKKIASQVRKICDEDVYASRWGGEEFLIVASGQSAYQVLREKIQELICSVGDENYQFKGAQIKVSITVGVANGGREDWRIEELINRADDYLYRGKQEGKNIMVAND